MRGQVALAALLSLLPACVWGGTPSVDSHSRVANVDKLFQLQRGSAGDPVTSLGIQYPLDVAIETLPIKLSTTVSIRPGGVELYKELYAGMSICFDSRNVH
jgi:hypothetical protein